MFKLYSKGCEYALRALVCASQQNEEGRFQAKDICNLAGIPESFARKTFQALAQAGFLKALRGPGGGYVLMRPLNEVTLLDVVHAVDGKDTFDHCVMGLDMCNSSKPCPIHESWKCAKAELLLQLRQRTLQDLSEAATGLAANMGENQSTHPR